MMFCLIFGGRLWKICVGKMIRVKKRFMIASFPTKIFLKT
jgi:hypothetical protein